jgi:hypothetical protein
MALNIIIIIIIIKTKTNSMKQSSASQEIPRILWNPNVQHRIYKSPVLSQIEPVHAPIQPLEDPF